jgi:gliding motility-associated-like protein
VYVIRQNGCVRADTALVVINPAPNLVVEPLSQITEIRIPVKISVSGAANYVWSPAAGLDNPNSNNPTVTIGETARFIVRGTTDKGCADTASALVIVDQEFKVFNGFSPNGDDINNEFEIKNIQKYPRAKVFIYNRWGNKVFESEPGYPKRWDGKFNGTPVPPGAYYYIIELEEDLKPIQGSITILR